MAVIIDPQKALRALRSLRGSLQSALLANVQMGCLTIGAHTQPKRAMLKRKKHQGVIVLYDGPIARVFEGEIHYEPDASGGHEFWTWSSLEREDSSFRYRVALAMPKMGARDHCCPFCASVDVIVVAGYGKVVEDQPGPWHTFCNGCHAHGPLADDRKEAMTRWDSIVNRLNGQ